MSFSVGPGVAQAMADNGDEPRSDELYIVFDEGHKISVTYGRDATYTYYQEDGRVNRTPFR